MGIVAEKFSLQDYIDVAERISHFNERYPEGSLQTVSWSVETVGERLFVVYCAAAYRTPDDRRPGHGTAWEPFPGGTPYTRDSELMNAETAAWGRAIVACGLTSNRRIASRQEVQARQAAPNGTARTSESTAAPELLPDASVDIVLSAIKNARMPHDWLRMQLVALGAANVPEGKIMRSTICALTAEQATGLTQACTDIVDAREKAEVNR
jgi:hypothetical protein